MKKNMMKSNGLCIRMYKDALIELGGNEYSYEEDEMKTNKKTFYVSIEGDI